MFFSTAYAFYGLFMPSLKFLYTLRDERRQRVGVQSLRHLKENEAPLNCKKVTCAVYRPSERLSLTTFEFQEICVCVCVCVCVCTNVHEYVQTLSYVLQFYDLDSLT
jgi:hypothetical protein